MLARIDTRQADNTRKRGHKAALLDHGLGAGHLRGRHIERSARLIQLHIRRYTAALQFKRALKVQAFQRKLALGRVQVGALHFVIKAQQNVALGNFRVRLKADLAHDASGFDRQFHTLRGIDCANRVQDRGPCRGLHIYGFDRQCLHRPICQKLGNHLVTEQVEPDQPPAKHDKQHRCNDKTFQHLGRHPFE